MHNKRLQRQRGLWGLILALCSCAVAAVDFLEPEQAFRVDARQAHAQALEVRVRIAPGYYVYRDKFAFVLRGAAKGLATQSMDGQVGMEMSMQLGMQLGVPEFPQAQVKYDPNFEKEVATYHDEVRIVLPLKGETGHVRAPNLNLEVTTQGCAQEGVCYPPMLTTIKLPGEGQAQVVWDEPQSSSASVTEGFWRTLNQQGLQRALNHARWWTVMVLFFAAGVLLSLTPCMLPMLPILSSIIVGQKAGLTRRTGLALSLAYSLGVALVYSLMGVLAGLLGEGLAAYLQTPLVLTAFALLLVVLALSMFGWYELQLPQGLRNRLNERVSRQQGGRYLSVGMMGALSALIVSPCVAAPLAGALVYIGQTGDVVLGGAALFVMAMGMSVPLWVIGVSAGHLLPQTGIWMVRIKHVFGLLLLAMSVWLIWPVLPTGWKQNFEQWSLTARGLPDAGPALEFKRIQNRAELEAVLQATQQPVMLDFYADWCVACIEMEKTTFRDPAVLEKLKNWTLIQVDVTANSAEHRALLKRFGLFGPPGMIFFDAQGRRLGQVVGEEPPAVFIKSIQGLGL